jgi:nitroreductase
MNQDRRTILALLGSAIALAPFPAGSAAAQPAAPATSTLKPVALAKPRLKGGVSLLEALARRRSTREFAPRRLSSRHLSEILWAAFGVNRPDKHRTAPTWRGMFAIDVYAVLAEGAYFYDAEAHRLVPHKVGNFQAMTGTQDFVAGAPLNLLYVAELSRMGPGTADSRKISAAADAACIGENVYLYCASERLGTVFRGNVDRDLLHKALDFKAEQYIAYAQTVGYPK